MRASAALGFRAHSGWATLVAVGGTAGSLSILLRRRIELSKTTPRQPFHDAEGEAFAEAERRIQRAVAEARSLALWAVEAAMAEVKEQGAAVVASGQIVASGRPLPDLGQILASHALIHAAEGELFREALRAALGKRRVALVEIKEREAEDVVSSALGLPATELKRQLAVWGKVVGPPWRQDEKLAALVAWLALGSRAAGRP